MQGMAFLSCGDVRHVSYSQAEVQHHMRERKTGMGQKERYLMIDFLRGFAVLLMIMFHFAFDLNGFRFIEIDLLGNRFWYAFPRCIVFLFFICVGMGLALVHKNGIRWGLLRKRFYKIGGWAFVISIVTYLIFPKNFVFFGILHCIAATSVAGVFLVGRPKLSLFLCFLLVIPDLIFQPTLIPISIWLGVTPMDYIPFYPWVGIVLFGIYLESVDFHKIPLKRTSLIRLFETMGKHSLKIYLLHRPVVFGMVFLLYKLKTPAADFLA